MKQNTFFTTIVCIVFTLTAISSFYFWFKANKIGWKYRYNWPDGSSPEEKNMVKKYGKKIFKKLLCLLLNRKFVDSFSFHFF
ncbi:hypothetical protein [Terrimonas pollutisoli]|uniref:hypothetical protein n=1 Tax=Terrimonas pollutisoli TaxID=3034147 RepID=UPI0023EC0FD8|nr:hypothetical protein [Terrimonas sp. H1YJ31]